MMLTTKEVSLLSGDSPDMIRWYVRNDLLFPSPERSRSGTLFLFDSAEIESWLKGRDRQPRWEKLDPRKADYLTTSDVLTRLDRGTSDGARSYLRQQVREGRFPSPDVRRCGKQGENLWLRATIERHLCVNSMK